MSIGYADVDSPGFQRGGVLCPHSGQWAGAVHDPGEHTGRAGWHMEHDRNGIGKVVRKSGNKLGQRFDAARRSSDRDHSARLTVGTARRLPHPCGVPSDPLSNPLPENNNTPLSCNFLARTARGRILAGVTPMQRYIAEEIATDHVDGLLSRREAMRRLALLGLTAGAASTLIAACGAGGKKENPASTSGPTSATTTGTQAVTSAPPGMNTALHTAPVTWTGPNGELQGAWAQAAKPRGGVLVIHENKGLNDWVRSVAGRLAGTGYSALAIDLLSEEGGTGK